MELSPNGLARRTQMGTKGAGEDPDGTTPADPLTAVSRPPEPGRESVALKPSGLWHLIMAAPGDGYTK